MDVMMESLTYRNGLAYQANAEFQNALNLSRFYADGTDE